MDDGAGQKSCATCRLWRWGLILTLTILALVWAFMGAPREPSVGEGGSLIHDQFLEQRSRTGASDIGPAGSSNLR